MSDVYDTNLPLYCTEADLYKFGMPRGLMGSSSRLVDSALSSTSIVTLDGHGFVLNDVVVFRATEGGSLAGGLTTGTNYYVLPLDEWTFQVSTSPSGSAVPFSSDAVSMIVMTPLPIDDVINLCSRWVEDFCPGHLVPFTSPFPIFISAIVAQLASRKLMQIAGKESASVEAYELAAKAQLERWAKGVKLRDAAATPPANLTNTATLVRTGIDPRGWGSGILPDRRRRGWGYPFGPL